MCYQHADLAAGRWHTMSLAEQLANVGSDVARAHRWQGKDPQLCEKAFVRALELLDLTIGDARWKGRLKELTRVRELLCDAMLGGKSTGTILPVLSATSIRSLSQPGRVAELGGALSQEASPLFGQEKAGPLVCSSPL